jgi:hypothetical protein
MMMYYVVVIEVVTFLDFTSWSNQYNYRALTVSVQLVPWLLYYIAFYVHTLSAWLCTE